MIGIIDYEAGNLASVSNTLEMLRIPYQVTSDTSVLESVSGIILPGVGAAQLAMASLHRKKLVPFIRTTRKPFLGICLGMQILFEHTEEGDTECLGVLEGRILKFDDQEPRVPHMGWNEVRFIADSLIFPPVGATGFFYFANSFYNPVSPLTKGETQSGIVFTAAVQRDNFLGTQFHPEKSGSTGLEILKRFYNLCESSQQ